MNAPDIDLERLREAVSRVEDGDYPDPEWEMMPPTVIAAALFLLDLADQGGELWMEKPCEFATGVDHSDVTDCHYLAHVVCNKCGWVQGPHPCTSCVRVWPPKEDA